MKPRNTILRRVRVSAGVLALSVPLAARCNAQSNFVSFDYPGATHTDATGITPSGNIVGRYFNADGSQHGFLRADGNFSSIDYPNATLTDVTAINPRGDIVGSFVDAQNQGHGFLLTGGKFIAFDVPGATFTDGFGIGLNGDVVGIYGDRAGTLHGYLLSRGTFTTVDVPGASGSLPAMIAAGRIIGGYFLNNHTHGFSLYKGQFTTIDCAGSTGVNGFQFLSGLDPIGRMVGGYGTSDGLTHGSLIINGNCIPIDIGPGTNTYANAIDSEGDIVGRYTGSDGVIHGFLLPKFVKGTTTPPPPPPPPPSSSKLGPHVLGVPNNAGAETILTACPRVAKWVAPYGGLIRSAISDYKTRCPSGTVILRVYVSPSMATYGVADDPVASANDFWSKMLAQGLSTEAGSPNQIDWLEGPNELDNLPNWYNDLRTAQWVASFWSALADLMHNAGYNPLVGSLVGGQPSPATVFAPLAAVMKSKTYKWGWSYHSYTFGATTSVSTETAYALYYRQVRDQNGLAGIPLVLSEGGYLTTSSTGWQGQLTEDQYLSWLKWFDAQLKQDPEVWGLTIFQVGNTTDWQSFDLTPIAPELANYLTTGS